MRFLSAKFWTIFACAAAITYLVWTLNGVAGLFLLAGLVVFVALVALTYIIARITR